MGQENVEVIGRIYERWAVGDFRAGVETFDEQLMFVQGTGFPEAGTYVGAQGVTRYMRDFLESWTKITIAAEEVIPAGDSVVVAVFQRGTGAESGAITELRYFHVWTFRGDRVVRWENFHQRSEALAAVGASD